MQKINPATTLPITKDRLEEAVRFCANLVADFGEVAMPLFDRAEHELIEFRKKNADIANRMKKLGL